MRMILILFVIGLSLAVFVSGQDIDKTPLITVSGTAEVMVAPDEAVFSLDVTKTDKDLQVAKRLNDEAVSKILELARRFSVEPKNIKTDYISVDMKYETIRDPKVKVYDEEGDETGKKVFKGYQVSKTVIVKLTDISRFEEFFAETLKSGITGVDSVKFETSKLRENRDKAREMAMRAAREKAAAMAVAVGQTIGKAIRIIEGVNTNRDYSSNMMSNSNSLGVGGTFSESVATFAPGAIKIEAQVTVSFTLN